MKIRYVVHRGLRRFIEHDDASGLPAAILPKVGNITSFLQDMTHESELRSIPAWKAHQLTGMRKGTWRLRKATWSLFVTRNWRITFRVDQHEIVDLDYEDYH